MNEKDQIKFNFMCALSMKLGIKLILRVNVLYVRSYSEIESISPCSVYVSITKHLKRLRMRFRAF